MGFGLHGWMGFRNSGVHCLWLGLAGFRISCSRGASSISRELRWSLTALTISRRLLDSTYYLESHCSSFSGWPYRILNLKMVKPREGSAMETIVTILVLRNTIPDGSSRGSLWVLGFRAERRRPNKSVINTMNI